MRDGDITISPALPEHAPAIYALSDATHAAHRSRLPHVFGPDNDYQHKLLDAAFNPEKLRALAFRLRLLVACRGDDLQGYVLVIWNLPDPKHAQCNAIIADIATFDHARGQGVGAELLAHLRAQMMNEGWDSLLADVWHQNEASHAMFASNSFTAERTEYRYGQPLSKEYQASETKTNLKKKWLVPLLIIIAVAIIASIP